MRSGAILAAARRFGSQRREANIYSHFMLGPLQPFVLVRLHRVAANQPRSIMGKEIELKLEVPPQELRQLKAWRPLSREGPGEQSLASVYFDTPKHKLGRNGISLRIRRNGKKRLQTIKSEGADGSFRRGEWENEIKGDVPDLRKVQGTALEPLLTKKLKHKLIPVFETRVRRTIRPVRRNGRRNRGRAR